MKLRTALLTLSIFLAGGASVSVHADPAKVQQTEDKQVIPFPEGVPGRASYLKTVKARFDTPNGKIGDLQKGWLCAPGGDLVWSNQVYNLFSGKLTKAFRSELEKAHYPVPVVSDAIFDEPKEKAKTNPELHVGMLIKDVAANLCAKSDGALGGVYMKIFWQVYSPDAQQVVFETTTEGSFQTEAVEKGPLGTLFLKAFEKNARNLLAEQGFYDVVANTAKAEAKTAGPEILKLKRVKISSDPLAKNITTLRSAVVTIVSDTGTGSGFFVSPDGYLLTNQHVVGGAKFVKVKLPTGRELVGETIRSDKNRDVALVKTEPIAVQPIGLRDNDPNIGEEVYALGSPLGDKFNTTLTRGILSGYRTMEEKRYLQSDVAILPGNSGGPLLDAKGVAIGITVAGLGAKGMAGMNFFIPINEALGKLGLELN